MLELALVIENPTPCAIRPVLAGC